MNEPLAAQVLEIIGAVDAIHPRYNLAGWVATIHNMSEPLTIEALVDGRVVSSTSNNITRPDTGANGFSLAFPFEITPDRVLKDDISFRAVSKDGRSAPLNKFKGLTEYCQNETFVANLSKMTDQNRRALFRRFDHSKSGLFDNTSLIGQDRELSIFTLPCGLVSPDRTAVVGKDGELFLLEGSNNLRSQYTLSQDDVRDTADLWLHRIRLRQSYCENEGISFVQTIIPEKTSAMRRFFPMALPRSTTIMEMIDSTAAKEMKSYLSLRYLIESGEKPFYRKLDSHFTPYGCAVIAVQIARSLGYDASRIMDKITPEESVSVLYTGDLGLKFTEMVETLSFPKNASVAKLVSRQDWGRQTGSIYIWENDDPIVDANIVVFGNSFFGHGNGAEDISWWFAQIFRNFHFIWSGEADWNYVSKNKPNAVVCQTIERFLAGTPAV